jgi:hypothetical protein
VLTRSLYTKMKITPVTSAVNIMDTMKKYCQIKERVRINHNIVPKVSRVRTEHSLYLCIPTSWCPVTQHIVPSSVQIKVTLQMFCIISPSSFESSAHEPKQAPEKCAQFCTTSSISNDMLRPKKIYIFFKSCNSYAMLAIPIHTIC